MDHAREYPFRRSPVFARNVVATSQPLAAQAGLRMLQDGGNAIAAALATAMALAIVEPTMNGIGSDLFAIDAVTVPGVVSGWVAESSDVTSLGGSAHRRASGSKNAADGS